MSRARWLPLAAVAAACSFDPASARVPDASGSVDAPPASIDAAPACETCPANDRGAGAIDVSAGLDELVDVAGARDDVTASCAATGGADVFYQVHLDGARVLYVDTFASDFDTVVSVHEGACATLGAEVACVDDGCDARLESQLAVSLEAGDWCLVVDQGHGGGVPSRLKLHVVVGSLPGAPLDPGMSTVTGDTCNSVDRADPSCESSGAASPGTARDDVYFFTVCPGEMQGTISTCGPGTHFDSIVYLRSAIDQSQLCNDDGCGAGPDRGSSINPSITGPDLIYLVVDGFDGACGPYELSLSL